MPLYPFQLVSTPITGPPTVGTVPNTDASQITVDPLPRPHLAFPSHTQGISPEAVLEAFTPTRGFGALSNSYSNVHSVIPDASEGGVIPASCYFSQEQIAHCHSTQGVSMQTYRYCAKLG